MSKNNHSRNFAPISVSQNFLTGRQTIRHIIRIAGLTSVDNVIEIGAGRGHITRELARSCASVSAYEIDHALAERLKIEFTGTNARIIEKNFLKTTLPRDTPYKVFANIPFSRTSEIIHKLTTAVNPPGEAWLVMEKGAAKRFSGLPNHTRSSLMLKPFFDMDIKYYFKREDFHPSPSVDVVMVHIKRKDKPDLPVHDKHSYEAFTNSYSGKMPRATGEMLYVQWLCLFRRWRGGRA